MGNSAVYRIHTGEDLEAACAMARRLLAHTSTGCGCPQNVSANVGTNSHDLGRYLGFGAALVSLSIPAHLVGQVRNVLEPQLPTDDWPRSGVDGSAWLATRLTSEVVAALGHAPRIGAEVSTPEYPLPNPLADTLIAAANTDPASISWRTCWPTEHNRGGFELAINSAALWHAPAPPGHSLYVHVRPGEPQLAYDLAAAVGGQVLGKAALGW